MSLQKILLAHKNMCGANAQKKWASLTQTEKNQLLDLLKEVGYVPKTLSLQKFELFVLNDERHICSLLGAVLICSDLLDMNIDILNYFMQFLDIDPSVGKTVTKKSDNCTLLRKYSLEYFSKIDKLLDEVSVRYVDNIGDFFIMGKELGAGGFGTTYLATHKKTGKKYAIKILRPENKNVIIETLTEIKLINELNKKCPNIILKYEEIIRLPGQQIAIIMTYIPGIDMAKYLMEYKITDENLYSITRDLLEQLDCMHKHNIIHRDIKPQNILIDTTKTPHAAHLIDFGLSCNLHDTDFSSQLCSTLWGTIVYYAPEQLFDGVKYTYGTDIWALGESLFNLITKTNLVNEIDLKNTKTIQQFGLIIRTRLTPRLYEENYDDFVRSFLFVSDAIRPDTKILIDSFKKIEQKK